ncbi:glycosyltransferase [Hyunsoonleella ulvae]|uniref:glycosyltransferase n=1 Tax=Hyunsoonleella ulvae TaxID=2799948 RepID=UPI001939E741|nr:glycosyltransferase [Hyunsoonleella ulvae]
MRVLQLIDSLRTGGSERMAINIANALSSKVEASFLCTTRDEGLLKSNINDSVNYLFLNKSSALDLKAISKLSWYIKKNKIDIIHAHSTSFFLATLVKVFNPKLKLIWHDHYGKSEYLNKRPKLLLYFCSLFFNHIFSVNSKLKAWAENKLNTKSITYLPNFPLQQASNLETINLKGVNGKRIVCLANLRAQKDHLTLLKAFSIILKEYPDWSLHLIGKDYKDEYSKSLSNFISEKKIEKSVFIYGSCNNTFGLLEQCDIGVLSSNSEGLPLALLEYGIKKMPTIITDVGDCGLVITDSTIGKLVPPSNILALNKAIEFYINKPEEAKKAGQNLNKRVESQFSVNVAIKHIVGIYKKQMLND